MKKLTLLILLIIFALSTFIACKQSVEDPNYSSSPITNSSNLSSNSSNTEQDTSSNSSSSSNDGESEDAAMLALFSFGANSSASHVDGNEVTGSKTYSNNGYTLTIENLSKIYADAFDAKGNSCLKMGSSSSNGLLSFTVPSGVDFVAIEVARYKSKTDNTLYVNGVNRVIGALSDNGEYDLIVIDTTLDKVVELRSCNRVMINSIAYFSGIASGDIEIDEGGAGDTTNRLYTDFTADEKAEFTEVFGEVVIPFIANDEYYVEAYQEDYDDQTETGIHFYTYGNSTEEYEDYLEKFANFTFDGSETFDYEIWYYFSKQDVYVDLSYYYYEGEYIVDVYVYYLNSNGSGDGVTETEFLYTDFTVDEKKLFEDYFGEVVIPFVSNNEYYLEEYTYSYDDGTYEEGLNFYTFGNTAMQFEFFKARVESDFDYDGKERDDYGDYWYYYSKGDIYVDISYYYYEGDEVIEVYVYYLTESSNGDNSQNQGGGSTTTPENVITNAGKGLPKGENGIFNIDFTKATYVKDVTEQGYYAGGCPTTSTANSNPTVLVVPVEFSNATASSKGYTVDKIEKAFNGTGNDTDYYSVHDYYFTSSYGKLDLDITVLDNWFMPEKPSTYYENLTMDYYGEQVFIGDQVIMDELLSSLSKTIDLSEFDSDKNDIIDAVIMINTLEIDENSTFNWAYRYWNIYVDENDYYYEYDGVSANDYLWASYQFLYERYDEEGNLSFDDENAMNTYTFIHEFGHILGADDYYDTAGIYYPLDGADIMDGTSGDHNPFTKFNYGWITSSRLITTESTVNVTIEDFSVSGDTVIIANNWDENLGAYQEYYVVTYYTNNGLNAGNNAGYFARDGIVVYHVNASLYCEEYEGERYYDIYNNNTSASDEYGTQDNLIEFVKSQEGNFTYVVGDSLSSEITDDQGNKISYVFEVLSLQNGSATLQFTKTQS